MARPRNPKSKLAFAGLRLKPYEDAVLLRILNKKELSYAKVARSLFRDYMEDNDPTYKRPVKL